jgi:anti-anti-sigma factor
MHMDIVETKANGAVTLAIKGRLDNATTPAFEDRVLAHIAAGDTRLIIDLAGLVYISSVGLRVFMLAAKRLAPLGGRIVVCALPPEIKQVFEIAGFARIFPMAATAEEAAAKVMS